MIDDLTKYIKENKFEFLFLFFILVFAFLIRVVGIYNHHDLWTDELYSLYFSEQSSVINVIKELFHKDLHSPFYFIILHFWSMLYHNSNFMLRFLGAIFHLIFYISLFYCTKDIFNKKTAYFATTLASISSFFIYYSLEIRHYSLIPLLSLFASYFFVKFLQKRTCKNMVLFILFDVLLLSTFNIAFMFVFAQFIVALSYLYFKNKSEIKNCILTFFVIGLLYIPSSIMVFHGFHIYSKATFQLAGNLHVFYPFSFLYFFLENFASVFFRHSNMNVKYNPDILFCSFVFFTAVLPIIFFLTGLFTSFLKKNRATLLFVLPSILFIFIVYFFACIGKMVLLHRYILLAYPMLLACACFGLTLLDKKKFGTILLSFWLFINLFTQVFFMKFATIKIGYSETSGVLSNFLKSENFSKSDYILFVHSGMLYKRYFDSSRYINLDANFISFPKDERTMRLFLPDSVTDEILSISDNNNRYDTIKPFFKQVAPSDRLRKYLSENYFSKMKDGDRVFVVMDRAGTIEGLYGDLLAVDSKNYYNTQLIYMVLLKAEADILNVCSKELRFKKTVIFKGEPNGGTRFQIYEKTSATP